MRRIEKHGILGWVATFFVVALFDTWAITMEKQTMSAAYHNGVARRATVGPVLFFWFGLTWHLIRPNKLKNTDLIGVIWERMANKA